MDSGLNLSPYTRPFLAGYLIRNLIKDLAEHTPANSPNQLPSTGLNIAWLDRLKSLRALHSPFLANGGDTKNSTQQEL
jgi:hypothetical protein